jgi:uncharacterized surface anchored protein
MEDAVNCLFGKDIRRHTKNAKSQSANNGASSGLFNDKKQVMGWTFSVMLSLIQKELSRALHSDIVDNGDSAMPTFNAVVAELRGQICDSGGAESTDV